MTVQQFQELVVDLSVAERLQIARWLIDTALSEGAELSLTSEEDVSKEQPVDGQDLPQNGSVQSVQTDNNALAASSDLLQNDGTEQAAVRERQLLEEEIQAFQAAHSQLYEQIPSEYAAIHQGKLVDHDADQYALYMRVQEQYKGTPVLIRQVLSIPEQDIVIRSPRFEHA